MQINVSKLANDIWAGIADDVKGTLTPADQVVLKEAGEHIAMYYVTKLTGTVTEADHRAVKAILANIKNTLGVVAAEALKRSFKGIAEKAIVLVGAL